MIPAFLRHRRIIGQFMAGGTLAAIILATLLPSSQRTESAAWCIVCGSLGGVDVLQNIVLFFPLGVGLALRGTRAAPAIASMCFLTCAIETLQMVIPGRDPTISDLITNSAGGALGFVVGVNANLLLQPTRRVALRLGTAWLAVWLGMQALGSYLAAPAATDLRYYGQIKRALGGRRPWPGEVIAIAANGNSIPNTAFAGSSAIRGALNSADGALFDLTIVPGDPPSRFTSIVRVVDANYDEILVLAQHKSDFVFGVRTKAASLRVRPRYFAMRDAFTPANRGRDTLRFRARYSTRGVAITLDGAGGTRASAVRVTPASAWRMVMPRLVYADGTTGGVAADALWVIAVLIPAVFWFAVAGGNRHQRIVQLSGAMITVVAGLVVVPPMFGLSGPGAAEYAGILGTVLLGATTSKGATAERRRSPADPAHS